MRFVSVHLATVDLHAIDVRLQHLRASSRRFSLLGYFTCQRAGVFPDTAQCAIGRYFYCGQAGIGKCLKSVVVH